MGDTVDRLLKRLDEKATAETYGNDDGTNCFYDRRIGIIEINTTDPA